ncbi:hypothetical protein SDC9_114433 [bioreactor metagenome]|uniref:Uncharacterized protein n=1 Tax=bioreactor metagenome TaxID=1076179 RepID=A0A645BPY5_9ZZZZ
MNELFNDLPLLDNYECEKALIWSAILNDISKVTSVCIDKTMNNESIILDIKDVLVGYMEKRIGCIFGDLPRFELVIEEDSDELESENAITICCSENEYDLRVLRRKAISDILHSWPSYQVSKLFLAFLLEFEKDSEQ